MAIKRMCIKCNKIIEYNQSRCESCENKFSKQKKHSVDVYNANRDPMHVAFYLSKEWKYKRQDVIARDLGLCKFCYSQNKHSHAHTVHHVEELAECWDKRLDRNNLISLCDKCHKRVHRYYNKNSYSKSYMQNILIGLIPQGHRF